MKEFDRHPLERPSIGTMCEEPLAKVNELCHGAVVGTPRVIALSDLVQYYSAVATEKEQFALLNFFGQPGARLGYFIAARENLNAIKRDIALRRASVPGYESSHSELKHQASILERVYESYGDEYLPQILPQEKVAFNLQNVLDEVLSRKPENLPVS